MRPFTSSEPKVMIPVANKPILHHVVEALVDSDVTDIVMVVGYHKQRIMSYFGNGEDMGADIEYVVQPKQVGTAHALYQTKDIMDGEFLVLPGDNLIHRETIDYFLSERHGYSILITKNEEPSKYGVVTMLNGLVKKIEEKPAESESHLISTGIYSLDTDIFPRIHDLMMDNVYDLTSVMDDLKEDAPLHGISTDFMWMDAVYPWDLLSLNSAALTDIGTSSLGIIEEGVSIKGDVKIGEGTVIKGGTHIEGPAVIGEGCEIGPQACILPSTSIGDDCRISPFTMVQNSIVMSGVNIGPNSMIDSSVIGEGVNIGAGFSSHADAVDMKVEDGFEMVEKIGCMIAEDTLIGSGVTVYPGVVVGEDCDIRGGVVLRERCPPGSTVL